MRYFILLIICASAASADFTTYIGGSNPTQNVSVAAIATDTAGNTYVAGNSLFTKLDSTGQIVLTATFGVLGTSAAAIAVDAAGNIWVGGYTASQNFPLINALQSTPPAINKTSGFLVKLAPNGAVLYSSYFGGTLGDTFVSGLACDHNGNVYVTGATDASDFPTTAGLPAAPMNSNSSIPVYGTFATKLDGVSQKIVYSTVIAGTVPICPNNSCFGSSVIASSAIAVDGEGNAIVASNTGFSDLPVTIGSTSGSGAFVFKINAPGNEIVYSTNIGPAAAVINDVWTATTLGAYSIAVDPFGDAYLTGYTNSPNFHGTPGTYLTTYNTGPGPEAFVMELNPAGATVWATFLGNSPNGSMANAVSLDRSDNVWLTGANGSSFTTGAPFIDELSSDGSAMLSSTQFPSGWAGQDIAIDQNGEAHVAGATGLVSTIAGSGGGRALSVVNAASGQFSGKITPGEIVSIYGSELTAPGPPVSAVPQNGLFPTFLGGVQVLVDGVPIPLLYVAASQINAEIPSPLKSVVNGIVLLQIMTEQLEWDPVQQIFVPTALPDFRLGVASSNFAAFEKSGGSMMVLNQDGTVNRIANPAKPGSVVSIWATGFGSTGPPVNGAVAPAANNYCSSCQVALFNGAITVNETVQYAGTSPGLIDGLMQINFMIPTQITSNGAWVYFTPPGASQPPPGASQPLMLGWVDISQ